MVLAGIVAEYNPFHKGHEFHIRKTREHTGADCIAVILSGDFVQRGEPAVMDKFLRAECALKCGADLVVELPLSHSLSSAETFAAGSVSLLAAMKADYLSFGSECGDERRLTELARTLNTEPLEFRTNLKDNLKKGMSFPKARALALETVCPDSQGILAHPNNTLGIEYIKEILKKSYPIQPVTITREGAGYHDRSAAEGRFPSAAAIRSLIEQNRIDELSSYVPEPVFSLMYENYMKTFPVFANDFSSLLYYRLTMLAKQNADFTCFYDVSPALANRIVHMVRKQNTPRTFYETADFLKTKELTYSRIMRCLMHILLDIHAWDSALPQYIRILGANQTGRKYLSGIKKDCLLPIITKPSSAKELLAKDAAASSLYHQIVFEKYHTTIENDFTRKIIQ